MNDLTIYRGFVSYSQSDRIYSKLIIEGLKNHSKNSGITWKFWNYDEIPIGREWNKVITKEIQNADFVLLLLSSNFITSDYLVEHEFIQFIKLTVIIII